MGDSTINFCTKGMNTSFENYAMVEFFVSSCYGYLYGDKIPGILSLLHAGQGTLRTSGKTNLKAAKYSASP